MMLLDDHGEEILRGWVQHPGTQSHDVDLVEQVLIDISYGDGRVFRQWHTSRVIDGSGDFVVQPREGLLMRVRLDLPEHPGQFRLVSIAEG